MLPQHMIPFFHNTITGKLQVFFTKETRLTGRPTMTKSDDYISIDIDMYMNLLENNNLFASTNILNSIQTNGVTRLNCMDSSFRYWKFTGWCMNKDYFVMDDQLRTITNVNDLKDLLAKSSELGKVMVITNMHKISPCTMSFLPIKVLNLICHHVVYPLSKNDPGLNSCSGYCNLFMVY